MISTATALTSASASRGSGPHDAPRDERDARRPATTAGTKYAAMRSASRWIGARLRCASPTIRTICASSVSLPTRSARNSSVPVPLMVPPVTRSPGAFSTGIGSPVTIDSSTALCPSTTTPSTGTFSPGRTRRTSPTLDVGDRHVHFVAVADHPRRLRREAEQLLRIAALVRPRARSSSTCPSSTSTVITTAVSK